MPRFDGVLGPCLRAGLLLAALLAAGCGYRPRAPALTDGSVYRNDREGFRFLVPEGWVQQAKGDVPPGPADQERLLVVYRNFTGERPAALEVSLADLPESTDLGKHLEGSAPLGVRWRRVGPPEPLDVHGAEGVRYAFRGRERGGETTREVVAFRRGGRVYFFAASFATADRASRAQARAAVDSVLWTR